MDFNFLKGKCSACGVKETKGWASSSLWQWQRGSLSEQQRSSVISWLYAVWFVTGRFLVGVYKDPSSSLTVFAITRADSDQQLWFCRKRSLEGPTCQPNSVQPHARLSTKELSCPCSGKAFLCGRNKTIQPTDQPATPFISYIKSGCRSCRWATLPIARQKPRNLTKKLLTEVRGVHAGSGEQLDPHRTYQPGSGRKEVCTCGPVVPLHTTPCLMYRYRAAWLLA